MAVLAVPMNIIYIVMFWLRAADNPVEARWRELIITSHTMLMVTMIGTAVLSLLFARRNALCPAAEVLQYTVVVLTLLFGISITLVDQLVTPTVTPFLVSCAVTAVMFLVCFLQQQIPQFCRIVFPSRVRNFAGHCVGG